MLIMQHNYIIVNLFLLVVNLCLSIENDYYEMLGVSKAADLNEIKKAFKKLAVMEHPDKNNDNPEANEKFIKLTKAYETLKDPVLRERYDKYGIDGLDVSNKRKDHSWNTYTHNLEIYSRSQWIIELDEHDYNENVLMAAEIWLINFYSPMCSHCHTLVPIWEKLAAELDGAVRLGVVNCKNEWHFCHKLFIQRYPTIIYYPKNTENGIQYDGDRTYSAIMNFILEKISVNIQEMKEPLTDIISHGSKDFNKPMIIFLCGEQNKCIAPAERWKITAVIEGKIIVRIHFCKHEGDCSNIASQDTNVIYLSPLRNKSWHIVPMENIDDSKTLIKRLLENLPEPNDLSINDLQDIDKHFTKGRMSTSAWLLCFYLGSIPELDTILKKLSISLNMIKLGKVHCGRHSDFCSKLHVNRYPMWAVLKAGGSIEWYHGNNKLYDILMFARSSIKATNVGALNAEDVTNILNGGKRNGAWFLDWYAPWCPPCMQFLKEVRTASMVLDKSVVQFGVIDCTIYPTICQRNNIHVYPTAMLVNGTNIHKFSMQKTASNIVHFVNELHNPTIIKLTSRNINNHLNKQKRNHMYVVDYFAPWCAPCQQLAPEWIAVANALKKLSIIKVASVDCTTESTLCASQGIRSYPTIRIYFAENRDATTFVSYSGPQDSASLLKWITQHFPRKVRNLNLSSLNNVVLSDRNVWIVNFYISACERCRQLEPQFAIVAELLQEIVQFGMINCDVYRTECVNAGIRVFPTLLAYNGRYGRKVIDNGFHINGTTSEDIRRNILNYVSNINHDEL